jgi:hypothetical protein
MGRKVAECATTQAQKWRMGEDNANKPLITSESRRDIAAGLGALPMMALSQFV